MSTILIPVQGSEEVVEVSCAELPDDANDIVDILQAEMAPLDLWLKFAVEYYKQGRLEQFKLLLDPLVELESQGALYDQFGREPAVKKQFIAILNALAAYHMVGATRDRDKQKKKAGFDQAKKYYDAADVIDVKDGRAMLGVAVLDLCQGNLVKAERRLDLAAQFYQGAKSGNVPALLGAAASKRASGPAQSPRAPSPRALGERPRALSRTQHGGPPVPRHHPPLPPPPPLGRLTPPLPSAAGQASVKFQMGQTKEALKLYREVFLALPTPPAPVRLGLAFCFAKLGQSALARRALERTLSLQEDNVEALTALAVIRLNEDNVADALQLLKRAYELEPSHPATLNQLANHYFYKAEHAKAQTLAKRSYLASASPAIRAEACYHMARSFHAQGDNSSALQWYTQSGKERPEYSMPLFGLGQMHMSHNDNNKAVLYFERALKHSPENVETLRVLGHLYAETGKRALALQHLNRATELAPDDVGAWLEMAKLHESRDAPTALKAYETAAGLLKRSERRVPLELWNNIGVLRHQLGKLATAEKAYRHALAAAAAAAAEGGKEDGKEGGTQDARSATINFNLSRLAEQRGERLVAAEGYKALLREHPTYLDCFLRLAQCARADGHPAEAVGWLKRALEVDPTSADTWCALGTLQVARREWVAADAAFRHVLTKCEPHERCKRDAYAQVSLANIQYIQYVQAAGSTKEGQQARLDKATEMYRSVLQHEPNNVYAANGLGTVCVEKGRLQEAREIFTVVREAAAGCEHALLNLAQARRATPPAPLPGPSPPPPPPSPPPAHTCPPPPPPHHTTTTTTHT
jgi:tetratricopeptide (TPR) repeat protein